MNLSGVKISGLSLKSFLYTFVFNSVYNFITGNYSQSGTTYDLGTLPGWAYSRLTDSNLTKTYVPQSPNLLPYSTPDNGTGWASNYSLNQITNLNVAIAPDGTQTASHWGDNYGGGGNHAAASTNASVSATNWAASGYFKYCSEITYVTVIVKDSVYGSNEFHCVINVQTGGISFTGSGGTGTFISASVDTLANGWFRLKLIGSYSSSIAPLFYLVLSSDSVGTAYPGSGLGWGCYLWGFQLEIGTQVNGFLPTYGTVSPALATIPATATNLLQGSSVLSNTTYWLNTALGSITGGQSDPTGGTSAFLLSQTASTNSDQVIQQSGSVVQTSSTATQHTLSVYAKAGTYDYIRIGLVNQNISQYAVIVYQFSTKTVTDLVYSGGWTLNSTSAVYLSNGWVRIIFSVNTPSSTTVGAWIGPSNQAGSYINGVSTNNIYVYGPQIEAGAAANPYVPTTTSSTASAAIPRVTNLGLWEEPQSINLDNATTASSPFVATGTTTTDPAGGNTARIQSQTSNFQWGAAAPWYSGNTYTVSFYVKSGGGSPALQYLQIPFSTGNVAGGAYANFDIINGTVTQSSGVTASITAVLGAPGWFRCAVTVLCSTTNGLQSYMWPITNGTQAWAGAAPGTASYYTLWGYQNEQAPTATTYILGNANGNAQRGAEMITQTYGGTINSLSVTTAGLGTMTYPVAGVTNLISYSNDFSSWTFNNSPTLAAAATTAPDGTTTAWKHLCNYTGLNCTIASATRSINASTSYVFSLYVKAGNVNRVFVGQQLGNGTYTSNYFDLSTNTWTCDSYSSGGYTVLPNGWVRIWTYVNNSTANASVQMGYFSPLDNTGTFPYNVTAGDYIYCWGAQVEVGTAPSGFVPTTTGPATRAPSSPFTLSQAPFLGQNIQSVVIS